MQYFKRFKSIDINYIYTDKHIHSNWSDGKNSILQIAKRAKELSLKQIAIVDHVREGSQYFNKYCQDIEKVSKQLNIEILVGFEAKVKNFHGDIDVSANVIESAQIKVGSVHRFPIDGKLQWPNEFKKNVCQEIELELSMAAIRNTRLNVLGHPGGMSLLAYKEFPFDFFEEIIIGCKRNRIAFELNTSYHSSLLDSLLVLLKKHDVLISLGSDAHRAEEIGNFIGTLESKVINE